MEEAFNTKKVLPKDVYITILEGDELRKRFGDVPLHTIQRNRKSGVAFIDQLAELINCHKNKNARFYESKMGLPPNSMRHFMLLYTGMGFKTWLSQYLVLAANELLTETDCSIDTIGKRLGYSGITSFSKWYINSTGEWPSDRRRWNKKRQAKQDAELLLKVKQQQNCAAQGIPDTTLPDGGQLPT